MPAGVASTARLAQRLVMRHKRHGEEDTRIRLDLSGAVGGEAQGRWQSPHTT